VATRVSAPGGAAPQSDTLVSSSVLTRSPLTSDEFEVDGLEARSTTPSEFSTSAFQENFAGVPVSSGSMPLVQPKLVVGPPNDKYEQEADRVADQVMGMPEPVGLVPPGRAMPAPQTAPGLQRQLVESESMPDLDDDEDLVQTKALGPSPSISQTLEADPQLQRESLDDLDDDDELVQMKAAGAAPAIASPTLATQLSQGGGHPLPSPTRHFMETRFGHDFGGVRVHSDHQAAQLNRGLNAQAFTHGHHVYFGQGQYQPQTHSGQKLLAHELTHTIQQGAIPRAKRLKTSDSDIQAKRYGRIWPTLRTSTQPVIARRVAPVVADPTLTLLDPIVSSEVDSDLSQPSTSISISSEPTLDTEPSEPAALDSEDEALQDTEELDLSEEEDETELEAENVSKESSEDIAPTSPEEDPAFRAVVARAKGAAKQQKQHDPAGVESQRAQAAAEPPENEVESKAQDRQVQEMDQQQPGTFNAEAFIAALLEKIDKNAAPKSEKEAEDFKKNNKLNSVKQDVSSQVSNEKQKTADPIASKTGQDPNTSGIDPKPFTPLEPKDPGPEPPDLYGSQAAPKPKTELEVSQPLEQNSQELEQQMAEADVDEETLATSGEPEFVAALGAKQEAQTHSATAPDQYRQEEQSLLSGAQAQASEVSTDQTEAMYDEREQLFNQVTDVQGQTKSQDEEKREEVVRKVNDIYEETKIAVETLLNELDNEVEQQFDTGAEAAKQAFENYVDREMSAYKKKRYRGLRGLYRRGRDRIFSLPPVVNEIYIEGRNLYLGQMRKTLEGIATHIAAKLNQAKQRIADGRQELQDFVATLGPELEKYGQEAAAEIQDKFDDLEHQVNSKQDELIDSLARRYQENLEAVDARIEEMKEANLGLIDRAKALVKGVVETIHKLRAMLENILARVREVASIIIKDPLGFFKNLITGLKQGFDNFVKKITTHLQVGLIDWLTGALGPMGIQIPEDIFSLEGIFSLVSQVLGITRNFIRNKAVNLFGEPVVAAMEEGVKIFQILMDEGPIGLWEYIKEQFANLKAMVMDQIEDMITTQVIQAGVRWILSLMNPVSAFIKAAMGIYELVMFFVSKASQIGEFINSVIDSIAAIAQGNLSGAAQMIENSLVKSLPLIIGFLASLLNISGLAQRVQGFIERLRQRIESAIDKFLQWLGKQARKLLRSLGIGNEAADEEIDAVDPRDHVAFAQSAAEILKAAPLTGYDSPLTAARAFAAVQEPILSARLEDGVGLRYVFSNRPDELADGNLDFTVAIAPNSTEHKDSIEVCPSPGVSAPGISSKTTHGEQPLRNYDGPLVHHTQSEHIIPFATARSLRLAVGFIERSRRILDRFDRGMITLMIYRRAAEKKNKQDNIYSAKFQSEMFDAQVPEKIQQARQQYEGGNVSGGEWLAGEAVSNITGALETLRKSAVERTQQEILAEWVFTEPGCTQTNGQRRGEAEQKPEDKLVTETADEQLDGIIELVKEALLASALQESEQPIWEGRSINEPGIFDELVQVGYSRPWKTKTGRWSIRRSTANLRRLTVDDAGVIHHTEE
jgi:hypothetical protein